MATSGILTIKNLTNQAIEVTTTYSKCCDLPLVGPVATLQHYTGIDLRYLRTDGHGCNGHQGFFTLQMQNATGTLTTQLNFDSHGNLAGFDAGSWQSKGIGPLYGKLSSFQVGNTMIIWQLRNYFPLPDLFPNPRSPTPLEAEALTFLLEEQPNTHDCVVLGSHDQTSYNCLAWAVGVTSEPLPQPVNVPSLEWVEEYLSGRNIARTDGSQPSNIIAWGRDDEQVLHFTAYVGLPNSGMSWTSKLGYRASSWNPALGLLVTHTQTAPKGDAYGAPLATFYDPAGLPRELCPIVSI